MMYGHNELNFKSMCRNSATPLKALNTDVNLSPNGGSRTKRYLLGNESQRGVLTIRNCNENHISPERRKIGNAKYEPM